MEVEVSLDRITITGLVVEHKTSDLELDKYLKDTSWEKYSDAEYRLKRKRENDDSFETVAMIIKNPYQPNGYRMDSSYHIHSKKELEDTKYAIKILKNAHLSRIDICVDFIGAEGYPSMAHDIFKYNASKTKFINNSDDVSIYTGRSQKLETLYVGKRGSACLYRYYNKLVEQKKRKNPIPENKKKFWERYESESRAEKSTDWYKNTVQMLKCFRMPLYKKMPPKERALFYSIEQGVVEWSELSKQTRAKYRKLVANSEQFDDTFATLGIEKLKANKDKIQGQINDLLNKLDVKKD